MKLTWLLKSHLSLAVKMVVLVEETKDTTAMTDTTAMEASKAGMNQVLSLEVDFLGNETLTPRVS